MAGPRKSHGVVVRVAINSVVFAVSLMGLMTMGCKSEARLRHERLAQTLKEPITDLCGSLIELEGGGCQRACGIRLYAEAGHAVSIASGKLAKLEPIGDSETDAQLVTIREMSEELHGAFEGPCSNPVVDEAPITPTLEACADVTHRFWGKLVSLHRAVDTLAASTKQRTGAELPTLKTLCKKP